MNVKFRMPKLSAEQTANQSGNAKSRSIVKELLLTIIATTISIVLTFGTAAWLEKREAKKATRLLAMTIISDIDQSLEVYKKRLEVEDKGSRIANYLFRNIDSLERVSDDTLFAFFEYLSTCAFGVDREIATSNEHIFNSSQDSWRTLSDKKFLSNVQDFYNARGLCERQQQEWVYYRKPLTKDDEYRIIMEESGTAYREVFLKTCHRLLQDQKVRNYVDYAPLRMNNFRDFLQEYVNLNEENKFLMGITEKDLEEFRNQSLMTVRHAKEADMVGVWDAVMANDDNHIEYQFRKDHTFTNLITFKWIHPDFQDKAQVCISLSGSWAIEGDSLVNTFDMSTLKIEVIDSTIRCSPEVAKKIPELKQGIVEMAHNASFLLRLKENNRQAQATNLDRTGTRLELTEAGNSPVHYQRRPQN